MDGMTTLKLVSKQEQSRRQVTTAGDVTVAAGHCVIVVIEHTGGWVTLDMTSDEARGLANSLDEAAGRVLGEPE